MKRIDDALRRLHDEVLAMPVPERFELAIRRLREREGELNRGTGCLRVRRASEAEAPRTEGRKPR